MLTLSSYLHFRVRISDVHNVAGTRTSCHHHYRNQLDRVNQKKRSSRGGGALARGWPVEVPIFWEIPCVVTETSWLCQLHLLMSPYFPNLYQSQVATAYFHLDSPS